MPQGHYFAWILGCYLEARSKAKFTVANHIDFDKDLANLNITPSVLVPGEALQSAAPHLGADVLKCATTPMSSKSFPSAFQEKIFRLTSRCQAVYTVPTPPITTSPEARKFKGRASWKS